MREAKRCQGPARLYLSARPGGDDGRACGGDDDDDDNSDNMADNKQAEHEHEHDYDHDRDHDDDNDDDEFPARTALAQLLFCALAKHTPLMQMHATCSSWLATSQRWKGAREKACM